MAYSVTKCKADLEGVLHGTTLNQISNVSGIFDRAARQIVFDLDPQETKRKVEIGPVYDQVFDYAIPADLKGNKVVDIRPQLDRVLLDNSRQTYSKSFDLFKKYETGPSFNIDFDTFVKTMRINYPMLNTGIILNNADSLAGNGTWVAGGSATNLRLDTQLLLVNNGSIEFDLPAGGSSGYVETTIPGTQDLTNHFNFASEFYNIYLPIASHVTSLEIRWGSDSSNYYTVTSTLDARGNAFVNGWNLIKNDWAGATKVLSPDYTKIKYLRITVNYDGTLLTGIHLNQIASRLGKIMDMIYYSKYLFRSGTTFYETYSEITDAQIDDSIIYINLDTECQNIFLNLLALLAVQQMIGQDTAFDTSFFQQKYDEGLDRYRMMYKSEIQQPSQRYYRQDKSTMRRFFGRNFNY